MRTWYLSLVRPPLTPPDAVFMPVWDVLYVLMGLAAWLVWRRPDHRRPLRMWGWQLLANAIWPTAFFGLRSPLAGFVAILILLVLLARTIRHFARVRPVAAWLLAPYFAWSLFAAYLNAGFWWLNAT